MQRDARVRRLGGVEPFRGHRVSHDEAPQRTHPGKREVVELGIGADDGERRDERHRLHTAQHRLRAVEVGRIQIVKGRGGIDDRNEPGQPLAPSTQDVALAALALRIGHGRLDDRAKRGDVEMPIRGWTAPGHDRLQHTREVRGGIADQRKATQPRKQAEQAEWSCPDLADRFDCLNQLNALVSNSMGDT